MDFVAITVATALVWKVSSMVKFVTAGDAKKALMQLVVWAVGIGIAFLLAASDFAEGIKLAGHALGDLNTASVVLFGFSLGSTAAAAYDTLSKNPEPRLMGER